MLSHTLPVYLPQISPGTHLELGRLWLSLQSHATDPRPKLKNWVHRDWNPRPLRRRIPNPAHQPTRPGRPKFLFYPPKTHKILKKNHTIRISVFENPTVQVSSSYLQKCGILYFLPEERSRMRVHLFVLFFSRVIVSTKWS